MYVESYDEEGAAVYDMIIKQIFQDLQLGPSIVDLRAFVDPKNAMFIFAVKMKDTTSNIYMHEVSETKYSKNDDQTIVAVGNENYLPNILMVLWREFGRENVHQPNRYAIVLEGNQMHIADFIVDNPQINLQKRIYDGIYRIIPEGFKVIKDLSRDGVVAVVATDELIKDDWVLKCENYIDELNGA